MHRQTAYTGQVPRTLDFLLSQQNAMVGLAKLASAVMGTSTLVDAFTCTPTTPASLNVLLTPGSIYQMENLEATSWSSVNADTAHSILKQGILLDAATFGITPPSTIGYSQVFLVEVQYQDLDTGPLTLPYYNAANPTLPFSGPGNAGTSQNTIRQGIVASQVKAGIAAATGTQAAPSPDAGWTGLFLVTVANGQTTITSGNITPITNAPFLATNGFLPQIPSGVQQESWTYAADTSNVANTINVAMTPALTQYAAGVKLVIKLANQITGASVVNVNGLGNVSVVHGDGSPLSYGDGNAGQMMCVVHDGVRFQRAWNAGTDIIDQNITFTVHGTNPNFANLNIAFEYLSKFKITQNGSVTLQLAAGVGGSAFAYTTTVTVDHPNADRITIQGQPLAATPTSSSFVNNGFASRSTDRATTLANLRACYTSELAFSGANGSFLISNGCTFKNLLITGDRVSATNLVNAYGGALFFTINVSLANAGVNGIDVGPGSGLYATGILSATGCGGSGLVASYGGSIYCTGGSSTLVVASSNDGNGYWCLLGNFGADGNVLVHAWSNAGAGVISATGNFSVVGAGCIFTHNGAHGIVAQYNGNAVLVGVTASNNTGYGVIASDGGYVLCVNGGGSTSISGNSVSSILAQYGSTCDALGATLTGSPSPAINTVGNSNSIIIN
jgi:hypothetical protein